MLTFWNLSSRFFQEVFFVLSYFFTTVKKPGMVIYVWQVYINTIFWLLHFNHFNLISCTKTCKIGTTPILVDTGLNKRVVAVSDGIIGQWLCGCMPFHRKDIMAKKLLNFHSPSPCWCCTTKYASTASYTTQNNSISLKSRCHTRSSHKTVNIYSLNV